MGIRYLPTAGDMDREPLEPVGLGVGLKCGVVARPALPLPPESLLFWPVRSCDKTIVSLIPQITFIHTRSKEKIFYLSFWL